MADELNEVFEDLLTISESHLNFAMNNQFSEIGEATESFKETYNDLKNKANQKLVKAGVNYVTTMTMGTIKSYIGATFISTKNLLKEFVSNIAIPMGMSQTEILDENNTLSFIKDNADRFKEFNALTGKVTKEFKKLSNKNEKLAKIIEELEMRQLVLRNEYSRSKNKGEKKIVSRKEAANIISSFNGIINSMNEMIESIEGILNTVDESEDNLLIQQNGNRIIKLISAYVTYISILTIDLGKSTSLITKIGVNKDYYKSMKDSPQMINASLLK